MSCHWSIWASKEAASFIGPKLLLLLLLELGNLYRGDKEDVLYNFHCYYRPDGLHNTSHDGQQGRTDPVRHKKLHHWTDVLLPSRLPSGQISQSDGIYPSPLLVVPAVAVLPFLAQSLVSSESPTKHKRERGECFIIIKKEKGRRKEGEKNQPTLWKDWKKKRCSHFKALAGHRERSWESLCCWAFDYKFLACLPDDDEGDTDFVL